MCRFVPLGLSTVVVGLLVAGWACSGPDESNGEHQQPAGPITGNAQNARLAEVRHWLYLIDVNLDEETIDLMAASEYDLVVLDFIPRSAETLTTQWPRWWRGSRTRPARNLSSSTSTLGRLRTTARIGRRAGARASLVGLLELTPTAGKETSRLPSGTIRGVTSGLPGAATLRPSSRRGSMASTWRG